jgi:hypothetical protein
MKRSLQTAVAGKESRQGPNAWSDHLHQLIGLNYANLPSGLPIIRRLADDRITQRVGLQNRG